MASPTGSLVEESAFSSGEPPAAPQLLDIEVLHVIRRFHPNGLLSLPRSVQASGDLADPAIARYEHEIPRSAIRRLRNHVTAYNAECIALAELPEAPILTCDARPARSGGHGVSIRLVPTDKEPA